MESLFKNYRVYIIGNIPSRINAHCRNRFSQAEKILQYAGFVNIVSGLQALDNDSISKEEAYRQNLSKLIHSHAVFVMSNTSTKPNENIELKIALDLNLMIMHDKVQVVDHYETLPESKYVFATHDKVVK